MKKIEYEPLNLPKTLVEELKIWKMAFDATYGRSMSYGEIIRGMLDSLEATDPAVVDELDMIVSLHPEFEEKLGRYNGEDSAGK